MNEELIKLNCHLPVDIKEGDPQHKRAEYYLNWVISLGINDIDAQTMIADLYYDCLTAIEQES